MVDFMLPKNMCSKVFGGHLAKADAVLASRMSHHRFEVLNFIQIPQSNIAIIRARFNQSRIISDINARFSPGEPGC